MFNSLTCKGLEYGVEAKRREKLKHVLNQWYSAYQQATLGKVATAYDELECMVNMVVKKGRAVTAIESSSGAKFFDLGKNINRNVGCAPAA